jgi:hypothetical protein
MGLGGYYSAHWDHTALVRFLGESPDRIAPPSRLADLLMKVAAKAVKTKEVPVLGVLLDETKQRRVVLELRVPYPVFYSSVAA